jgi:hypothetical protein
LSTREHLYHVAWRPGYLLDSRTPANPIQNLIKSSARLGGDHPTRSAPLSLRAQTTVPLWISVERSFFFSICFYSAGGGRDFKANNTGVKVRCIAALFSRMPNLGIIGEAGSRTPLIAGPRRSPAADTRRLSKR